MYVWGKTESAIMWSLFLLHILIDFRAPMWMV